MVKIGLKYLIKQPIISFKFSLLLENPLKLTTQFRFKVTTHSRFKLTRVFRSKLTTPDFAANAL